MTLLGLDLSLRAAAAVAVPLNWDGEWRRVLSIVVGEPLRRGATDAERIRRAETIAARITSFAVSNGAQQAWIESYAFGQRTAAHSLGELGGIVRLELARAGIELRTANISSARKLLLGHARSKDIKVEVFNTLRAAGAALKTFDESDAFCAENLGLSENGGYCFASEQ